eukprot:2353045-Amphidinium_carterae.1
MDLPQIRSIATVDNSLELNGQNIIIVYLLQQEIEYAFMTLLLSIVLVLVLAVSKHFLPVGS